MPSHGEQQAALQAQDFASYLRQIREEEETKQKMRQTTADRRHTQHEEQAARSHADQQARRITPCDGATSAATRTWIRQVDLSMPYSNLTVYIASQSAQGQLQIELEHFLNQQQNRSTVPWTTLKSHIQQAFLSTHEDDRLRNELEKIKQGAYESTTSYARRFRELTILAFPIRYDNAGLPLERSDLEVRLLLRAYTSGLKDHETMVRLLRDGRPTTAERAMAIVLEYEADAYTVEITHELSRAKRTEEPMEVGAISEAKGNSDALDKRMTGMERQMTGLTQQFTKLMAVLEKQATKGSTPPRPQQTPNTNNGERQQDQPNYQFSDEGVPICHYCNKTGHVRRICRTRARHNQQNQGYQGTPSNSGNQ